jgi:hypothetical protein
MELIPVMIYPTSKADMTVPSPRPLIVPNAESEISPATQHSVESNIIFVVPRLC